MSIPVVIGSKILGLTIILLEPNMVLGRGNRFFLNFAKKYYAIQIKFIIIQKNIIIK